METTPATHAPQVAEEPAGRTTRSTARKLQDKRPPLQSIDANRGDRHSTGQKDVGEAAVKAEAAAKAEAAVKADLWFDRTAAGKEETAAKAEAAAMAEAATEAEAAAKAERGSAPAAEKKKDPVAARKAALQRVVQEKAKAKKDMEQQAAAAAKQEAVLANEPVDPDDRAAWANYRRRKADEEWERAKMGGRRGAEGEARKARQQRVRDVFDANKLFACMRTCTHMRAHARTCAHMRAHARTCAHMRTCVHRCRRPWTPKKAPRSGRSKGA